MPLVKKVSLGVNDYMLRVFNAMAISTKYFKIRDIIIMWISIFMMNTKNSWFFIKSTSIAYFDHYSVPHHFAYCSEGRFKSFLGFFVHARFGAIFSIMTGMANKFLMTMMACVFSFPFITLRNIIAVARTIFGFITARRDMRKIFIAYKAVNSDFSSNSLSLTAPRTIF